MKTLLMFASFMFVATFASAQTATFTQGNIASTTQAAGFTYKLYVTPSGSTTQNPAVTLTSVTCTGTAPTVSCSGTFVALAATVTGAKSTLTATDPISAIESAQSAPFSPGASAPTGLKVQ